MNKCEMEIIEMKSWNKKKQKKTLILQKKTELE